MFKENFFSSLTELAAIPGGSGREQKIIVKRHVELIKPYSAPVEVDHMDNIYAEL